MHELVIDGQFLSMIRDDQNTDRSASLAKGFPELIVEVALINNFETLLDLTRLGHGNELAIITDVNEAVLLEDGSEERVENNGWRWMRDNTRLLMELFGEEVDTKVSVLTSLGRCGDANDLAWAVLKDHEITNANVMAWDGESIVACLVDRGDMRGSGGGLELLCGLVGLDVGVGVVIIVVVLLGHFGSSEKFAVGRDFF